MINKNNNNNNNNNNNIIIITCQSNKNVSGVVEDSHKKNSDNSLHDSRETKGIINSVMR